jgi:hypothetical protein
MTEPTRLYSITHKGKQVLGGPTVWCLSAHMRDALALCDPATSIAHLRQAIPPDSLNASLYALWDLGLVVGPAVPAPDHSQWAADARSRPIGLLRRAKPARSREPASVGPGQP